MLRNIIQTVFIWQQTLLTLKFEACEKLANLYNNQVKCFMSYTYGVIANKRSLTRMRAFDLHF